ncbi:hypothetical protein QWA68_015817 [Fusarium oxysporum]|nr:hypothetical protein QWA68_015817 [Fusarium oxysporum]
MSSPRTSPSLSNNGSSASIPKCVDFYQDHHCDRVSIPELPKPKSPVNRVENKRLSAVANIQNAVLALTKVLSATTRLQIKTFVS